MQDKHNNDVKFSLAEDSNGDKYVKIDTEQNIFEGIAYEDLGKVAKAYLKEHFRGVEIDSIKINNTSVDEYTMSRITQRLYSSEREAYTAKMKAATELDNFIKASIFNRREVAKNPKTKDGYDIYDIIFEIDDKKFSGEMLIAVNGDKKLFYDITKIKKKMSPAIQVFPKGGGASSSNNSICNLEINVNNSATESLENDEKNTNIDENSNNVQDKHNNDVKFSLAEDSNGDKYVKIDTEQNIFDNVNIDEYGKTAKEYIKNRYKNVVVNETIINKTSAEEFTYSKSTRGLYKGNSATESLKNDEKASNGRNIKTLLEYATNNNEILYFDKSQIKKVSQLFNTHGLQLPAPLKTTNFNNSISNSETNVNNSATESLENDEKATNIDENSNIENTMNAVDSSENSANIVSNSQNIDENSNILLFSVQSDLKSRMSIKKITIASCYYCN